MHNILVVDHNPDSCRVLAKLLTVMGDKAICALSGQQALDSLEIHIPRLVILDMMMPDMDGIEVLRLIRNNPKTAHLPVIIFTGIDDAEFALYARNQGAAECWVKGTIDYSTLHSLVAPYVDLPTAA